MHTRRLFIATMTASTLLFSTVARSAWWSSSKNEDDTEILNINWDDLIPDDFAQPESPFASMSPQEIDTLMNGSEESQAKLSTLREAFNNTPVVEALDGKRVRIPAYITPLEFNEQSLMNEFLLVPYVGACIHTPPPPANQVVHAKIREAIKLKSMYDPVWAIGIIRTETTKSELAESSYKLEVEKILPYRAP